MCENRDKLCSIKNVKGLKEIKAVELPRQILIGRSGQGSIKSSRKHRVVHWRLSTLTCARASIAVRDSSVGQRCDVQAGALKDTSPPRVARQRARRRLCAGCCRPPPRSGAGPRGPWRPSRGGSAEALALFYLQMCSRRTCSHISLLLLRGGAGT